MPETTSAPRPDTSDMLAVHNVFRETLAEAPHLIGAASGDPLRSALVGNFYSNILDFLHVHHDGEDVLMTPLLLARAGAGADIVRRVAAQHKDVMEPLHRAEQLLPAWSLNADADQGRKLSAALRDLDGKLAPHLGEEEVDILPLAAEYMSMQEWGALPGHAFAHFSGDKLWLIIGLVFDHMTYTMREEVLAHMPPPVHEMWTGFGERSYHELVTQVHSGT